MTNHRHLATITPSTGMSAPSIQILIPSKCHSERSEESFVRDFSVVFVVFAVSAVFVVFAVSSRFSHPQNVILNEVKNLNTGCQILRLR